MMGLVLINASHDPSPAAHVFCGAFCLRSMPEAIKPEPNAALLIVRCGSGGTAWTFCGLLVDCDAAKMPTYQRLSLKFRAKARLTIGRMIAALQRQKVRGPSLR